MKHLLILTMLLSFGLSIAQESVMKSISDSSGTFITYRDNLFYLHKSNGKVMQLGRVLDLDYNEYAVVLMKSSDPEIELTARVLQMYSDANRCDMYDQEVGKTNKSEQKKSLKLLSSKLVFKEDFIAIWVLNNIKQILFKLSIKTFGLILVKNPVDMRINELLCFQPAPTLSIKLPRLNSQIEKWVPSFYSVVTN